MSVQIAGHMSRKKVVKNMSGDIVDLFDEANGGWIIRKGEVVNHERYAEIQRQAEDDRIAAMAQAEAVSAPPEVIEERQHAPSKMEELEKRVDGMDDKLDSILAALKKK